VDRRRDRLWLVPWTVRSYIRSLPYTYPFSRRESLMLHLGNENRPAKVTSLSWEFAFVQRAAEKKKPPKQFYLVEAPPKQKLSTTAKPNDSVSWIATTPKQKLSTTATPNDSVSWIATTRNLQLLYSVQQVCRGRSDVPVVSAFLGRSEWQHLPTRFVTLLLSYFSHYSSIKR